MANDGNEKDELIGFKDFLDGEDKSFLEQPNFKKRINSDFELVTFLQHESTRISNHIETFEEKVYILKNYSQFPNLLVEAETQNIEHRVEAIELCTREDSPLFMNLSGVFANFFK